MVPVKNSWKLLQKETTEKQRDCLKMHCLSEHCPLNLRFLGGKENVPAIPLVRFDNLSFPFEKYIPKTIHSRVECTRGRSFYLVLNISHKRER